MARALTLPGVSRRRLIAVRPINKVLTVMSEFGDNLPASVVIYALAAILTLAYGVR